MKYYFISVIVALLPITVYAQNSELLRLRIEARLDYTQEYIKDVKVNDNSGFKGKYLNIRMDGNLAEGLSYSYRQRLNKPNVNATFFDAERCGKDRFMVCLLSRPCQRKYLRQERELVSTICCCRRFH